QGGLAGGDGGGHGKIFRDGDGHVIEPVAGGGEAAGKPDDECLAIVDGGAEGTEDVEVRINLPHAERAALGVGGNGNFFQPVEQGGVEQDGRTHVLGQLPAGQGRPEAGMVETHLAGVAIPFDPRTLGAGEGDELVEVGDVGDVFERDRLVGEEGGAEDGQDGVFIAGGDDGAGERLTAVDDEVGHQTGES